MKHKHIKPEKDYRVNILENYKFIQKEKKSFEISFLLPTQCYLMFYHLTMDIAFTFKPNNGYQVSKVYVDGRETPIAANSFSFKKVNANHTLSVTFEQAKKIDSPKTGDAMKSKPVIAIMAVSGIILIGIVLYTIKKKK